jgi:hypothetical protein
MSNRRQSFIVVRKTGAMGKSTDAVRDIGAYLSKPGDARRSGRAAPAEGLLPVHLDAVETSASIELLLGTVTVGAITQNVGEGYFWDCYLPGFVRKHKPVMDADKARRAIEARVREWCEAAGVVSIKRGRQ